MATKSKKTLREYVQDSMRRAGVSTASFDAANPRFDAGESVFTLAALSYIEAQVYYYQLPPIEHRKYVPVDNSSPPGATNTRYRMLTRTGTAQFVTDTTDDLPNAALFVKEYGHDFVPIGTSYSYGFLDLLSAAMAAQNGGPPINLDMELALASREAIERKLDRIAAFGSTDSGDPSVGLVGLLNNANANSYSIPNGLAGSPLWSLKTPDEIIADMTGIIAAQVAATFKVFKPKRELIPITQFETIAGRSMGDGRSDTILSYFMKTREQSKHPVEVDSWQHCTASGNGGTDRMVAYDPNPRFVRHMIAMEFTQLPPEYRSQKYKVECLAKTAGVISPYPISISYGDGI